MKFAVDGPMAVMGKVVPVDGRETWRVEGELSELVGREHVKLFVMILPVSLFPMEQLIPNVAPLTVSRLIDVLKENVYRIACLLPMKNVVLMMDGEIELALVDHQPEAVGIVAKRDILK
jgi:uncharacterized membrane protein YhaH (DUF805 family)